MNSTKRLTKEEFIERARKIHGNKYDYSKVEYKNNKSKVCIICPIHGEFWQTPKSHLMGRGCMKCGINLIKEKTTGLKKTNHRKKINTEKDFIRLAEKIHNNKYDYSKVEYINNSTKVCIICPIHGEFWQTPHNHLDGHGCLECGRENKRKKFALSTNSFIKRSNEIFHNYYNYTNVNYVNNSTKVLITCPQHGDFTCTPANHLKGRGCPLCKVEMYVYENRLYLFLKINYQGREIIRQYRSEWLSNHKSLDFFFPNEKIAIEHQGAQHFQPIEYLGGKDKFNRTRELDLEKYKECQEHGIKILYFSYEKSVDFSNFFAEVYNEENNLKQILNQIL